MEFMMKYKLIIISIVVVIVVLIIIYNSGKKTGALDQAAITPTVSVLNPYDLTTYAKKA